MLCRNLWCPHVPKQLTWTISRLDRVYVLSLRQYTKLDRLAIGQGYRSHCKYTYILMLLDKCKLVQINLLHQMSVSVDQVATLKSGIGMPNASMCLPGLHFEVNARYFFQVSRYVFA